MEREIGGCEVSAPTGRNSSRVCNGRHVPIDWKVRQATCSVLHTSLSLGTNAPTPTIDQEYRLMS